MNGSQRAQWAIWLLPKTKTRSLCANRAGIHHTDPMLLGSRGFVPVLCLMEKSIMVSTHIALPPEGYLAVHKDGDYVSYTGRRKSGPQNRNQLGSLTEIHAIVRQAHRDPRGDRFRAIVAVYGDGSLESIPLPEKLFAASPSDSATTPISAVSSLEALASNPPRRRVLSKRAKLKRPDLLVEAAK